jgi:hypothetical protein
MKKVIEETLRTLESYIDELEIDRDNWMDQAAIKDQIISKHETKLKYYQSYMAGLYDMEKERDEFRARYMKLLDENRLIIRHLKKFDKVKRALNMVRIRRVQLRRRLDASSLIIQDLRDQVETFEKAHSKIGQFCKLLRDLSG